MKKLIFAIGLFSVLQAGASHIYFQNPTYCRASWTCDVVSTTWKSALDACKNEVYATTPATVYQDVNGKMELKGYGCYDPIYSGGGL
jgi:hypothetical protein